jgi:hypothetical protein
MVRKLVSATVSAALCTLGVAPAMAQDYRFSGFDAPQGATATLNLRVPFGASQRRARASYGLTFGYGATMGGPALDGRTTTRSVTVADFRFSGAGELRNARVASFDLAHLDRDRRLNLTGGNTTWFIVGAVAVGIGACILLECFDGGDQDMAN